MHTITCIYYINIIKLMYMKLQVNVVKSDDNNPENDRILFCVYVILLCINVNVSALYYFFFYMFSK